MEAGAIRRFVTLDQGLWFTQTALALAFGVLGLSALTTPVADLSVEQRWAAMMPASFVRPFGALELATAWLLFAPALTRIAPWLTPTVAAIAALVAAGWSAAHAAHGHVLLALGTITLASLSAFVAWGRAGPASIAGHAYLK
jgi:hypothetical protein